MKKCSSKIVERKLDRWLSNVYTMFNEAAIITLKKYKKFVNQRSIKINLSSGKFFRASTFLYMVWSCKQFFKAWGGLTKSSSAARRTRRTRTHQTGWIKQYKFIMINTLVAISCINNCNAKHIFGMTSWGVWDKN